jgi:rhamnulokinase
VQLDRPNLSEDARLAGFTNESGAAGTFRFLTNIMGLWLVQEARRAWVSQAGEDAWGYEDLMARAAALPSPDVLINVDDPAFLHPNDMPAAIKSTLSLHEAERVERPEAMVRAILESLALAYRVTIEEIERLTGREVLTIHIVGGGSRNSLLCQLTADATGREVVAGPSEATALGNVLIQAMGAGELAGMDEACAVARASAQVRRFEPSGARAGWSQRYAQLLEMRARTRIAGAAAE